MYLIITNQRTYEMITDKAHFEKIRNIWQDYTEILAMFKWHNGQGWLPIEDWS